MRFILASNSPRRKEILEKFGYEFTVVKSAFAENSEKDDAVKTAMNFATGKAWEVFQRFYGANDAVVLGADTVVSFGGKILGKPSDEKDAEETLLTLSGNRHTVVTGYAVLSRRVKVFGYDISEVYFNKLSRELIKDYVNTGKPLDKAGSYGVQDGFNLVKNVVGSVYNVIGLPIEKIAPVLDFAFTSIDK